jgi:L-asparaginase II
MDAISVAARRGGIVESVHRVHAVAVQDGAVSVLAGDSALVTFLRSSAKPFQALPLARVRPDLDEPDLAIACASHHAQPAQIDAVRSLLAQAPASEDELECGEQEGRPPGPIHHNCSGMHAGMLAVCRARGWPTEGYRLASHPLQREILRLVIEAAGVAPETAGDGCRVPTFALPLEAMARMFSRLRELDGGLAVMAAMRSRPELIGGELSLDTRLMRARPGWIAKGGAEGLMCGLTPDGVGFALKAEDGNQRPLGPALAAFLGVELLERTPVLDWCGEEVGEVVKLP